MRYIVAICAVVLVTCNISEETLVVKQSVDCGKTLRIGQYYCPPPQIDPSTQQPKGCTPQNIAKINCTTADLIECTETNNNTFQREIPCKYTDGYSLETAVLLSVFLGMFGVDRFYLGYPAIGIMKFCTLGFMFLGQLIDIILIATQVVGPADGSHYIISYYGPVLHRVSMNNMTVRRGWD